MRSMEEYVYANMVWQGSYIMFSQLSNVLHNSPDNHILPFFWQHGEDEATLRHYMDVIQRSHIQAVCVESRPHPQFCGERWWHDLDIILDEARTRHMQVWVLDDSHFPTGYANGALAHASLALRRQGLCYTSYTIRSKHGKHVRIACQRFLNANNQQRSILGTLSALGQQSRLQLEYPADSIFSISAIGIAGQARGQILDLSDYVQDNVLNWNAPSGVWKIAIIKHSYRCGAHPEYINMLDPASCKLLIDAVYEPHFEHYSKDFGTTFAGFFSDEPELGNGALYNNQPLGNAMDLPWSETLYEPLVRQLGEQFKKFLPLLWENSFDPSITAQVRVAYMDSVSRAVQQAFSTQIGQWCANHHVQYIGHSVEDNNNHARTGAGLGHYFRALSGQDMAGIDDIGGQVIPFGESQPTRFMKFIKRDGAFYHYILGKLGSSLATIDPRKHGNTMCEIFGNYGWSEGLHLERYLLDHFMVRGVNNFVPHAFSPKAFPDPDCPPHFYAQGHNPQYRHFGVLMDYTNRICTLLTEGQHSAPIALLYHAEAEWAGEAMLMQNPAKELVEHQLNFEIIPLDVFTCMSDYCTRFDTAASQLIVNEHIFNCVVIPYMKIMTPYLRDVLTELYKHHIPVFFVDRYPSRIAGEEISETEIANWMQAHHIQVVPLHQIAQYCAQYTPRQLRCYPHHKGIHYMAYTHQDNTVYMITNEGHEIFRGDLILPRINHTLYWYNAWSNRLECCFYRQEEQQTRVTIELQPLQTVYCIDTQADDYVNKTTNTVIHSVQPHVTQPSRVLSLYSLQRSICSSKQYPDFTMHKVIQFPDHVEYDHPRFSGWVRYEGKFRVDHLTCTELIISQAYEGVEVVINGHTAGIQVCAPYRFDLTEYICQGENTIIIDVSTTLERERAYARNKSITERLMKPKTLAPTGITGEVHVYQYD